MRIIIPIRRSRISSSKFMKSLLLILLKRRYRRIFSFSNKRKLNKRSNSIRMINTAIRIKSKICFTPSPFNLLCFINIFSFFTNLIRLFFSKLSISCNSFIHFAKIFLSNFKDHLFYDLFVVNVCTIYCYSLKICNFECF